MTYILITVKPSKRFPNKNKLLANFTIDWLLQEIPLLTDPVIVYTIGYRDELPEKLPNNWKHIEFHKEDHHELLKEVEKEIGNKDDIFVLAQLTQPIRRKYLLVDVINSTKENNCSITYCTKKDDSWRVLDKNGKWRNNDNKNTVKLYDGALYGWKYGYIEQVLNKDNIKGIVENYYGNVIDIDDPIDLQTLYPKRNLN